MRTRKGTLEPYIAGLIALVVSLLTLAILVKLRSVSESRNENFLFGKITIDVPVRYELDFANCSISTLRISSVTLYGYTNDPRETDSSPNIARSGRVVYEGSIAISQDLLGTVQMGDLVYVSKLKRFFIAEDTLHERHTRAVDVFTYSKKKALSMSGQKTDIVVLRVLK